MDKESLLITKNNAIGFAFYLKNNNNPTIYIAHQTLIPYESYDNGATWNPIHFILSNLQEPPVFHFNDVIEGRAVSLDGFLGQIMITSDGGKTWTKP